MRHVVLDYGKSYFLRLQLYMTVNALILIGSIVIISLWWFNVIELDQSFPVVALSETLILFVLIFLMLFFGAKTNE